MSSGYISRAPELPVRYDDGVHEVRFSGDGGQRAVGSTTTTAAATTTHPTASAYTTPTPDIIRALNYSNGLGPTGEEKQDTTLELDVPAGNHVAFSAMKNNAAVSSHQQQNGYHSRPVMLKREHGSRIDVSPATRPAGMSDNNIYKGTVDAADNDDADGGYISSEDAAAAAALAAGDTESDNVRSTILELCEVKRQEDLLKRLEIKAQRAIQLSVQNPNIKQQRQSSATPHTTTTTRREPLSTSESIPTAIVDSAIPHDGTSGAYPPLDSHIIPTDAIMELDHMPFTYNSLGRQHVEKKRRVFSATVSRAQKQQEYQKRQSQAMTPQPLLTNARDHDSSPSPHQQRHYANSIASPANHKPYTHRDGDDVVDSALNDVESEADREERRPYSAAKISTTGQGYNGDDGEEDTDVVSRRAYNPMADGDVVVGDEFLVQCRSAVPIAGKTAFTVPFKLGRKLQELRNTIASALNGDINAPPPSAPTFTIHNGDNTLPLPNNRSFLDLGFRFPPLITIRGLKPTFYIQTAGSTQQFESAWSPHMSLTDVCKAVNKKVLPHNFSRVRLSVLDMNSVEMGQAMRRLLPIAPCLRFPLCDIIDNPQSTSLARAGLEKREGDPIRVRFMRSICGVPFYFNLPDTFGNHTAWEVAARGAEYADDWLDGIKADPVESRAILCQIPSLTSPKYAASSNPPSTPYRAVGERRTSLPAINNATTTTASKQQAKENGDEVDPNVVPSAALSMQFDDHDELISPLGIRSVFVHESTTAATATSCAVKHERKSSFKPKGPFVTLSYNPTVSYITASRSAEFVSIEDNYTIRHATDCGIFPGSLVLVEHLDIDRSQWSGNVFEFGTARRLPVALSQPPEGGVPAMTEEDFSTEEENAALYGGGGGAVYLKGGHIASAINNRWLIPQDDYLTIRSHRGVPLFRIPANSQDRIQIILERIWAVTGDPPSSTLLFSERGELLQPYRSLDYFHIAPTATVLTRERPCVWLNGRPEIEALKALGEGIRNEVQTAWGVDVLSV